MLTQTIAEISIDAKNNYHYECFAISISFADISKVCVTPVSFE